MGCPCSSSSIARLMRLGFGACAIGTPTAKTRDRETATHHRSVLVALMTSLHADCRMLTADWPKCSPFYRLFRDGTWPCFNRDVANSVAAATGLGAGGGV